MMRSALTVACALFLVISGVTAGAADVAGGAGPAESESLRLTQQDFDRTEFTIEQYANGSARWTFTFTRTLTNESEKDAFRSYAEEFNTNETELYSGFVADARALTRDGSNVTGRNMTATRFTRHAGIDEGFSSTDEARGVVRMSFLWTEFAATDGDRVIVADVFEGGLYIGPSQSLVVQPGPDLVFRSVDPAPTSQEDPDSIAASDSVTWQGEQSFADQRPRIVFGPPDGTPTGGTNGAGATATATPSPTPGAGDGGGVLPWLALLLVVLLALAGGYAYRSGALGGDDAAAAATTGDGDAGGAAPDISNEELMSDEDRVIAMLEERGGRMKQVNIVEETGWSKSKVSMLLSDMEDEGKLSKLRVGRENIVSLSGHEPEAAGSPFDDEE
jgi:hypothetical protein